MSAKTPNQLVNAVKQLMAEIETNMYIINQHRYIHEVKPELETDEDKKVVMEAAAQMCVDLNYISALLWVLDPEDLHEYPDTILTLPEIKAITKRLGIE